MSAKRKDSLCASSTLSLLLLLLSYVIKSTHACSIIVCPRKNIFLQKLQVLDTGISELTLTRYTGKDDQSTSDIAYWDPNSGCLFTNSSTDDVHPEGNPVEYAVTTNATLGFTVDVLLTNTTATAILTKDSVTYSFLLTNARLEEELYRRPLAFFVTETLQRAYLVYPVLDTGSPNPAWSTLTGVAIVDINTGDVVAYDTIEEYPLFTVDGPDEIELVGDNKISNETPTSSLYLAHFPGARTDCVTEVFAAYTNESLTLVAYETIQSSKTTVVSGILAPSYFRGQTNFEIVRPNNPNRCTFDGTDVILTEYAFPSSQIRQNSTWSQAQLVHLLNNGLVCPDTVVAETSKATTPMLLFSSPPLLLLLLSITVSFLYL